jgi:hypothetical protein
MVDSKRLLLEEAQPWFMSPKLRLSRAVLLDICGTPVAPVSAVFPPSPTFKRVRAAWSEDFRANA